jgi:hypothetical protein
MEDYEISTTAAVAALKAYRASLSDRVVVSRRRGEFTEIRFECGCRDFREFEDGELVGAQYHHCHKHGGI